MSKWDKLLCRLYSLSPDLRFEELQKILEAYGYTMTAPKSGSGHYTFRKKGRNIITIPKHKPKALMEHSKKEGVSMNQYCVYLLSMNDTKKYAL